jgi:type VI secretion system protein ImpH
MTEERAAPRSDAAPGSGNEPARDGPPARAAARGPARQARTLEAHLFEEGYAFDFYQAVRLLQRLRPQSIPVGQGGPPDAEAVRFRALCSLSFPASSIYEIERSGAWSVPRLTQAIIGLTGPSGVLPRHYTELLFRVELEAKGRERHALRDWFDLFNHRLVSFFYRAWEKYRFFIPFERGEFDHPDPDPFTRCLLSLVGLGTPHLKDRLSIVRRKRFDDADPRRFVARIEDLSLLYYSGLFAHRPRCAQALEAILRDYFQVDVEVIQFQGQWLVLDALNQSRLGDEALNNRLGEPSVLGERVTVIGDRVWDVQSKIRIRLGPLRYGQFVAFLPRVQRTASGNAFFLLCHLARLYVGPELDFDVQVILAAADVPECQLSDGGPVGPLLGWNTWVRSGAMDDDARDAVFEGREVYRGRTRPQTGTSPSPDLQP